MHIVICTYFGAYNCIYIYFGAYSFICTYFGAYNFIYTYFGAYTVICTYSGAYSHVFSHVFNHVFSHVFSHLVHMRGHVFRHVFSHLVRMRGHVFRNLVCMLDPEHTFCLLLVSVLTLDDEYRQLQATYSFPWSHDYHHLHEVTLVPMARSKPPISQQPPQHAAPPRHPTSAFSIDGRVICQHCTSKWCQMQNCSYAHVCSQKFKGKVCSGSHPATQHGSLPGPSK